MVQRVEINIPKGVDAHVHFRQGAQLRSVVSHTARKFTHAVVMPNLQLPGVRRNTTKHITTLVEALAYREEVLRAVPKRVRFTPLMTVSLTNDMMPSDLREVMACEHVVAAKFYAGHTTNAEGVDDVTEYSWAFEILQRAGKPLLLHGEAGVTVDVFERERRFYGSSGEWIVTTFPELKIVCEHITTGHLVHFVQSAREGVAATITPQHLLSNRNDMLGRGGIRPDLYCMPILKTEADRQALLVAATSGSPKFFLGTDSAPHPQHGSLGKAKYSACGCAGCFTAYDPYALYAQAFHEVGKLHMLGQFASGGRTLYGLPQADEYVTIAEVDSWAPDSFEFGDEIVAPYVPLQGLRFKTL